MEPVKNTPVWACPSLKLTDTTSEGCVFSKLCSSLHITLKLPTRLIKPKVNLFVLGYFTTFECEHIRFVRFQCVLFSTEWMNTSFDVFIFIYARKFRRCWYRDHTAHTVTNALVEEQYSFCGWRQHVCKQSYSAYVKMAYGLQRFVHPHIFNLNNEWQSIKKRHFLGRWGNLTESLSISLEI